MQDLVSVKGGFRLLKEAGMKKLNFAGGGPFLYSKVLGQLVDYCKEDLNLEALSIVTDGSLVTERFLAQHSRHIDILVAGKNDSDQAIRDVRIFMVSDDEYEQFCERLRGHASFVPESNRIMARSYLILNEYMHFLDRDRRQPSPSILGVELEEALSCVF